MEAASDLCFDIINLLVQNIKPKVQFNVRIDCRKSDNENEFGVVCLVQFLEYLRHSSHYIRLNDDQLYEKLIDLANEILLADFGEVCTFQNYLLNSINDICELLKSQYNRLVKLDELIPETLPSQTDTNIIDVVCEHPNCPNLTKQNDDPIYSRIADLLNSVLVTNTQINFSAEVDDIVNSLDVKYPVRCKTTFLNRLRNVKEAVSSVLESDTNVNCTRFLKYQIDEIYTLLKKDIFYDNNFSIFTKCKLLLLSIFDHLQTITKEKLMKLIHAIKRMFIKTGELLHISNYYEKKINILKSNCKQFLQFLSSIAVILLNCFALGTVITM